jgi:NAD(P) transhydrogenase subunit alpha
MNIVFPKETHPGETRVAATPNSIARLRKMGASLQVEAGLGETIGVSDTEYEAAGASVVADHGSLLSQADVVMRVRRPPEEDISLLKKGAVHISFLDPFNERALLDRFAGQGVSAISMELIPRTTRAQKMDALSSQANLAGYEAVVLGASYLKKALPMMTTAAGTIPPSKVFVIGAGVAGLQAIATAKRMGARVEAFDTRPTVAEQVRSLGAKFVEIDLGETGQTAQGYARELTPEQLAKQREAMKQCCAASDLVITTAQVFGRKAPIVVTADMVAAMKAGSVVVDLAVEQGGNVEGSAVNEVVEKNGVLIVGLPNLAAHVPQHASQVYAMNLVGLLEEFWDKNQKAFVLKPEDDIIQGCLLTHAGEIWNSRFKLN